MEIARLKERQRIVSEGYPFIAIAGVVLVASLFLELWFFIPSALLVLFVTLFFRNPKRTVPEGNRVVIAPADGKILSIEPVDEGRFLRSRAIRVGIFMSPLNVHVNRMPVTGTVELVSYHKGHFRAAFKGKASTDNEHNVIVLTGEGGRRVLFVQIAGFLARRIVCYAQVGERWAAGDIFGMIRFGSRVDVYLPTDCRVKVATGMIVKAGETILAEW